MTEADWLAATDPEPMLAFLRDKVSDRKLRLFACACCRSMFATVQVNPRDRDIVSTAERYADGLADSAELRAAVAAITVDSLGTCAISWTASPESGFAVASHAAGNAAEEVSYKVASRANVRNIEHPITVAARSAESAVQATFIRDIFGNSFYSVANDPSWITSTVQSLAEGIYADRAFDRMPILADALEDVGCDSADILTHCRGDGPHVRGCWVVDWVLGKK